MKKIIIAFAALSLVLGCTKGIEQKSGQTVERVFTASFDEQSKTSLDASGKVDWSKDDAISYYTASEGSISSVTVPEDSHSFSFTATVGVDDSFIIAAYGGTISTPQGKSMTLTSNAAGAEQSGKFEDAHVSVCKRYFENGNTLSFKGITSLIKFSLTRTDVAYVTFTADDGTKIHGNGKLNFTFSGEDISAAFGQDEGGSTIRVNTGGADTFFFASLPCYFAGFTMKYYDSSNRLIGSTSSTKTLTLGSKKIVDLGTLDARIEEVPPVDLSANGTANCYIASESGVNYKFKATVKGGSTESVGTVKKAKVLWESFGTDVVPNVGDVVSSASFDGEYIKFTSGQNGNAVIAAADADGDILWSWHIWVCDGYDPDASAQVYNNNAGTMMDRNLGATSATPGDVHALGLLYQWGRKDPFLGGQNTSANTPAESTSSWPSAVPSNEDNGTIAYAVAHPTTFITSNSNNYDWYYSSSSLTDNTRWKTSDTEKGLFDPCPAGWRVPDGGILGLWSNAFGFSSNWTTSSNWDATNMGINYGATDRPLGSGNIWYPATGFRIKEDGSLVNVGNNVNYWACKITSNKAFDLFFSNAGRTNPSAVDYRSHGFPVRCVKEDSQTEPTVTDLSKSGTANCYIVSGKGKYKIKSVKGNSNESIGAVKGVKVLWESFGTGVKPAVGELIKADVSFFDSFIYFNTNDTYKEGNAVIAAYSNAACTDGNVLWSWHIWLTDKPSDQVYNNNAGTLMDRNLGATSSTAGDVCSLGLLYQWGRKDPFLNANSVYDGKPTLASSTLSWPSPVQSTASNGTIAYAVAHPTTFITYNETNSDWYYSKSSTTDNTRWRSSPNAKGLYDPCPVGYRVPNGGYSGVWYKALNNGQADISRYNKSNGGVSFNKLLSTAASSVWYPCAGILVGSSGEHSINHGQTGSVWSSSSYEENAVYVYIFQYRYWWMSTDQDHNARVYTAWSSGRGGGLSVRCAKE